VAQRRPSATSSPKTFRTLTVLTLAVVLLLAFLAIYQLQPPVAVPPSAPPVRFSSGRAIQHLKAIAQKPHPTGSSENDKVRLYIVRQLMVLGLEPRVQVTTASYYEPRWGGAAAATVQNVVARLKGTSPGKAVMLVAHYDSVPTGPGASDDGTGVATLLETARALKAGPKLKNDVIFLVTDGEELGLLGAKAFAEQHAWVKDVGVALNFEARGGCGPSMMFETSKSNRWLIREFAKAVSHAVTSSLMYELYKRLPNDTDLTIFKRAGLAGLNFAYVSCWPCYHTMGDSVTNTDERSIQHHGSYALALARQFGNLDLGHPRHGDAVYFSLFGFTLYYPQAAVIPLMIVAVLLFVGVVTAGLRKGQLTWRGMTLGLAGWLAGTALATGLSYLLWAALRRTPFVSSLPYGMAYNSVSYATGCAALTVTVLAALYVGLRERARIADLSVGMLAWWTLLTVISSLYFPGGSYLFLWPLVSSLVGPGYALARHKPDLTLENSLVWMLAPAVVGILLFAPLPYLLIMLLSTTALLPITVTVALLMGFLAPQIHLMTKQWTWWVSTVAALATLAFLITAMAKSGYDAKHPRADSLFYVLNADTGKAVWASADESPDGWTSQFLNLRSPRGSLAEYGPFKRDYLKSPAPALPLAGGSAEAVDDLTMGEVRMLRLRLIVPSGARIAWIAVPDARVLEADLNGKPITYAGTPPPAGAWEVEYTAPPKDGFLLTLQVKPSDPVTVRLVAVSDGLPYIPGASFKPRPDELMPSPSVSFDSCTLVSKTFHNFAMHH